MTEPGMQRLRMLRSRPPREPGPGPEVEATPEETPADDAWAEPEAAPVDDSSMDT